MARQTIIGYNIILKIGGKSCCGTTQNDLTITAKTKESIYKSLQGNSELIVTGHDIAFSAQGLCMLDDAATPTELDMDALLEQALKNGANAVISYVWTRANGDSYTGNCVITSYKESSNSEDTANWSADFKGTGAMTKVTGSGSGNGN